MGMLRAEHIMHSWSKQLIGTNYLPVSETFRLGTTWFTFHYFRSSC